LFNIWTKDFGFSKYDFFNIVTPLLLRCNHNTMVSKRDLESDDPQALQDIRGMKTRTLKWSRSFSILIGVTMNVYHICLKSWWESASIILENVRIQELWIKSYGSSKLGMLWLPLRHGSGKEWEFKRILHKNISYYILLKS